jgi:hypothetical protein
MVTDQVKDSTQDRPAASALRETVAGDASGNVRPSPPAVWLVAGILSGYTIAAGVTGEIPGAAFAALCGWRPPHASVLFRVAFPGIGLPLLALAAVQLTAGTEARRRWVLPFLALSLAFAVLLGATYLGG